MKILVTGGAGFIGSHLVDRLLSEGHNVVILDNLSTGNIEKVNKKAKFYEQDITDYSTVFSIFEKEKPEYVFHLAALPRVPRSIEDPIGTNQNNVNGTLNILEASRKVGAKRVIYSASSSAYGLSKSPLPLKETSDCIPLSPYGLQKYIGELYCWQYSRHFNLDTVCLRYFNVFGEGAPEDGAYCLVMGVFLKQKREGKVLTIFGDGEQTRDYTYIDDIVEGNILAMKRDKNFNGDVINLGTGIETSVNRVAELIGGESEHIIPNPREQFEERRKLADNSKAKNELGWSPKVTVEEGIKRIKSDIR